MNWEFAMLDFIQEHIRCGLLDFLMPRITTLGNAGIIWIALTIIFLISKKYRTTGIVMAVALIVDLVFCNMLIKPIVARTRPYDINTAVTLLIPKQVDYSFPSGHTAASFTAVCAMYKTGCKYWKPAAVLSVIIAFSRLYLYVHFPTDVIAGAMFGIIFGIVGFKIYMGITRVRNDK
ncbi:MAG: phosphatase PAP2 family protein [Clostridia bacterium]|nr:phosphatase PAP2 family protein [Clostridia bacterium]